MKDDLKAQINQAMKNRDELRVSTLKMLSSELHNAEIAKQSNLQKEDEMAVVKKEAKKRKDAIEAYKNAGNEERAKREADELTILEEFLPEEMGDEELERIVEEAISETGATSQSDMGKVMSVAMGKVKGQADGNRVSAKAKEKIS